MTAPAPLIGLTGRRKQAGQVEGFPASFADVELDVYVVDYARAVLDAGGLPVHIPQDADPVRYLERLDALLLSGGGDVEPARYGVARQPETHPPERRRDDLELALADGAMSRGLPVLGICRGLQLLNVAGGGTLNQHVPGHARYDVPGDVPTDSIDIEAGTLAHELYGSAHKINSLHHQTVDQVADGWIVAARSADGTIEVIELPGRPAIGVQWHPELMATRSSDPLFAWLVARASEHRAARI